MDYSSSDEANTNEMHTNKSQNIDGKKKRKKRGAIMMDKLTKVCNSDDRLPIEFNDNFDLLWCEFIPF